MGAFTTVMVYVWCDVTAHATMYGLLYVLWLLLAVQAYKSGHFTTYKTHRKV